MKILTIPNLLTLLRIIIIPIAVYNIYISNFYTALFLVFIAVITDGLDGFVARRFDQVSQIGKVIDPLADKLLVICGLSAIVINEDVDFSKILFGLIILREIYIVSGGIYLLIKSKRFKIAPTIIGKLTAFSEFLMFILILLNEVSDKVGFLVKISSICVITMIIISIVQYSIIGLKYLKLTD
jgi:cardiolipin synthase